MNKSGRPALLSIIGVWLLGVLPGCATTHPLPAWVSDVETRPGYYRAVGFGEGSRIPEAIHEARRNALMQIVESSFGESVRYVYSETSTRSLLTRSSSVDDFFQSASSGSLFGQRVVHNEVETAIRGYVAYVLIEVSKKDLKDAYVKFIEKKKAQKELVLAETRGAVLLETRHYRKALDYYRKMVRKDPKSDVWWIGVGAAFYRLGEYRAALDATDNGLLRNPLSFYGYWNRASILRRLGRPRAAIESLGEACRLRPSQACSRRLRKERLGVR